MITGMLSIICAVTLGFADERVQRMTVPDSHVVPVLVHPQTTTTVLFPYPITGYEGIGFSADANHEADYYLSVLPSKGIVTIGVWHSPVPPRNIQIHGRDELVTLLVIPVQEADKSIFQLHLYKAAELAEDPVPDHGVNSVKAKVSDSAQENPGLLPNVEFMKQGIKIRGSGIRDSGGQTNTIKVHERPETALKSGTSESGDIGLMDKLRKPEDKHMRSGDVWDWKDLRFSVDKVYRGSDEESIVLELTIRNRSKQRIHILPRQVKVAVGSQVWTADFIDVSSIDPETLTKCIIEFSVGTQNIPLDAVFRIMLGYQSEEET